MSKLKVSKFIKQLNSENVSQEGIVSRLIEKINSGEIKTKQNPEKVTRYYLKYYKYTPKNGAEKQLSLPSESLSRNE